MKYTTFAVCLFLSGYAPTILAQTKIEMETRIRPKVVPDNALTFIDQLHPTKKQRWFKETSHLGTTVECKFKHNKQLHSIEFSEEGILLDMEICIEEMQIRDKVLETIKNSLNERFDKWRFVKIQVQYSGEEEQVRQTFNTPSSTTLLPKYEIVLKGKVKKIHQQYECLFDNNGNLIEELLIPSRNTDNLEY